MYISPYCRLVVVPLNFMKFSILGQLTDVIKRQIFSESVQGLRSSDTPKLPFPTDLLCRRYNSVRTAMRHCDSSHLLSGWLPIFHHFFLEPTVTNPQKFIKGCDAEQGSFIEAVFSLLLTAIHAAHCIAIHNFLSYHRHAHTHTFIHTLT